MDVAGYGDRRNFLDGPVTRLSPYLTHGILAMPEVVEAVLAAGATPAHKLVFELAWREYWQHVWRHLGVGILRELQRPLSRAEYAQVLPRDVLEARSGLRVIDQSVRALYETGYLHNHARMWLASYLVHLRKVHWRAAADWMYGHLLDGDLASNHLSWQWVAGTFSGKPYLFNRENVERYAPGSGTPGSAIDRSYPELDRIARSTERLGPERGAPERGVTPPRLLARPSELLGTALPETAGLDVVLVHPWSLTDRVPGQVSIGVVHTPFHAALPWSDLRWSFVLRRMQDVADGIWVGEVQSLIPRLHAARTVRSVETLNPGYRDALRNPRIQLTPAPRYFEEPDDLCRSFSQFWKVAAPCKPPLSEPA